MVFPVVCDRPPEDDRGCGDWSMSAERAWASRTSAWAATSMRVAALVVFLLACCGACLSSDYAGAGWKVTNGARYVPLDALADFAGVKLTIQDDKIDCLVGERKMELRVDSPDAVLDGTAKTMEGPVISSGGSVYAPVGLARHLGLIAIASNNSILIGRHDSGQLLEVSESSTAWKTLRLASKRLPSQPGIVKVGGARYIPLRALAAYSGAKVIMNGTQVLCDWGGRMLKVRLKSPNLFLAGNVQQMKADTRRIAESTYVPVELLDNLGWNYRLGHEDIGVFITGRSDWLVIARDGCSIRRYELAFDIERMKAAVDEADRSARKIQSYMVGYRVKIEARNASYVGVVVKEMLGAVSGTPYYDSWEYRLKPGTDGSSPSDWVYIAPKL